MEWATTLERFGSSIGIDHLVPDVDNSCSLLFDNEYEVTFTHDEEDHSLLMYCEIGSAAALDKDICLALLKASLLGAETGGAALSVHEPLQEVVIWKRYDDSTLNTATMRNAVNDFLAQASVWKKRLVELAALQANQRSFPPASLDTMRHLGLFV